VVPVAALVVLARVAAAVPVAPNSG